MGQQTVITHGDTEYLEHARDKKDSEQGRTDPGYENKAAAKMQKDQGHDKRYVAR
jgi:hypothetical protein